MAGTKACSEGPALTAEAWRGRTSVPGNQPLTSLLCTLGGAQSAEVVWCKREHGGTKFWVAGHRAATLARHSASPDATAVRPKPLAVNASSLPQPPFSGLPSWPGWRSCSRRLPGPGVARSLDRLLQMTLRKRTVARCHPVMPYLNAPTRRTSLHRAKNLAAVRLSAYNDLSKHMQMILDGSPARTPRSHQALRRRRALPDQGDRTQRRCCLRIPAPAPRARPDTPDPVSSLSAPARR
jgi:hypothetical protein